MLLLKFNDGRPKVAPTEYRIGLSPGTSPPNPDSDYHQYKKPVRSFSSVSAFAVILLFLFLLFHAEKHEENGQNRTCAAGCCDFCDFRFLFSLQTSCLTGLTE